MSIVAIAGTAFTYYLPGLEDKANPGLFKASPTITASDFTMSTNGGAFGALTNTPTVSPAGGTQIAIVLSAAETTAAGAGGRITVMCQDAAGAEWYSVGIAIPVQAADVSVFKATDTVSTVTTLTNHPDTAGTTTLLGIFNGITSLPKWLRGLYRKDAMDATAKTEVNSGGGAFSETTDSLEANRDNIGTTGAFLQINSVSGTVTLADDGITADKLAASAIAEIAAAATGLTAQQVRDAMKLAPTAGTPADGSIDDHLDDLATALAAATATLTVVSAVDGGELAIYQAVSFQATISGLSIPADWTKVYWTVKRATSEADADAILQLVETNPAAGTDGLLRLNGAAGTAANGTLTVSQAAGTVVIDLVMTICDDLALATGLVWSLKALHPTSASTLLAIGTVNVLGQATMAVA